MKSNLCILEIECLRKILVTLLCEACVEGFALEGEAACAELCDLYIEYMFVLT